MSASFAFLDTLYGQSGRVAIVTGSTGGLGRAFAAALFQAGAKVIINGRTQERADKARDEMYAQFGKTDGLLAVAGDVSKAEDAGRLVDSAVSAFGRLDIVINNAGINIPENNFENNTAEEWENISAVNMRGPINLTRAALPHLKQSPAGRIINSSSIGGHVGLPNNVLYTCTKGAMLLFTKSLAAELATTSVTVNSISPGVFETPMNSKFAAGSDAHTAVTRLIPMGRMGKPDELVGAVLYLSSNAASYCTGTDILVDGGYSCV